MTSENIPSGASGGQPPGDQRIHVDADWKKEAQAEKERLAREAREGGPAGAAGAEGHPMPPASFATLAETLATQAALFMAERQDPQTGKVVRHLDIAKHHIDLLGVLEEKTKGNLTPEEKRLLDTLLYELRMAYVSAAS